MQINLHTCDFFCTFARFLCGKGNEDEKIQCYFMAFACFDAVRLCE